VLPRSGLVQLYIVLHNRIHNVPHELRLTLPWSGVQHSRSPIRTRRPLRDQVYFGTDPQYLYSEEFANGGTIQIAMEFTGGRG
jgi:hypothetical protein